MKIYYSCVRNEANEIIYLYLLKSALKNPGRTPKKQQNQGVRGGHGSGYM